MGHHLKTLFFLVSLQGAGKCVVSSPSRHLPSFAGVLGVWLQAGQHIAISGHSFNKFVLLPPFYMTNICLSLCFLFFWGVNTEK